MVVVRSLKDILALKIKARHDSPCDQFSRLFMTKMFLIAAVIMGFDYFSDRISCIHPKKTDLTKEFIHAACWISGFYVYKEMRDRPRESGYYGIPYKIDHDGIDTQTQQLCLTNNVKVFRPECQSMTRIYYLQYQWMPFYIGALGVLYYLPYILFRIINVDLISLKSVLKSVTSDADHIVRNYFNYKINSISKLRMRVVLNLFVKCLYIVVNLFGFYFTDYLLHGNYRSYGTEYVRWARSDSARSHLPIKFRKGPKPGNHLLPTMGYCEVEEASKDQLTVHHNSYVFLCEISTNILYQYVLVVLWFLFIISICISIIGLLSALFGHLFKLTCYSRSSPKKTIYRVITLREAEYLNFIKTKNMVMYGEVLRKLKQQRSDLQGKIIDGFETSNGFV
uniref:Innexin n=1 Tax=Clytia hemisphaerica TaxID=252671 RepID=A0A7M5XBA1_9CNID